LRSQVPALDFQQTNPMTTKYMIAAILTLAIFVLYSGIGNGGEVDAVPEGAELFMKHCASCHGEEANGQDPSQPAGGWDANENQLAPALDGTGHAWHHSPELLFNYVHDGSIDRTSPMPSFAQALGDNQILAIISYFQSLWPDRTQKQYMERFPPNDR